MNYEAVKAIIEQPTGEATKVKEYQQTDDIIKDLVYCFKAYNYQAKPVAKSFYTGNVEADGKKIYDFIKNNIKYVAESDKDQTTRSFARIIHDKWGDCKHSALIVGSIGWNEGYNVIFRVVRYLNYSGLRKQYLYHVYTVLQDRSGKKVIVDPLQAFNYEKPYEKLVGNFKANNNMTLTRLSGIGNNYFRVSGNEAIEGNETYVMDGIGGREMVLTSMGMDEDTIGELEELQGIGKSKKRADRQAKRAVKKAARKAAKPQKKAARKAKRAERKEKRKARGGLIKAIALAPVRGAFSALLLLNFKNFAGRFKSLINEGKENEVKAFAKKFGYKYNIFKNQILKGAAKKALGSMSGFERHEIDGMGVVVTSAAITAAATAIAAAIGLFKRFGKKEATDDKQLSDSMNDISLLPSSDGGSGESYTPPSNSGGGGNYSTSQVDTGSGDFRTPSGSPNEDLKTQSTESEGENEKSGKSLIDIAKENPIPTLIVGAIGTYVIGKKVFKLW